MHQVFPPMPVAKEKCDDQAGNARDVCRKEAKAVETKALADAKMGKQMP
jgi:hypothetical protein